MKLIIDIDEEMYKRICKAQSVPDMYGVDIVNALNRIKNGKPYEEKSQSVLISRKFVNEVVCAEFVDLQDGTEEWRSYVNDTCESILKKIDNAPAVSFMISPDYVTELQNHNKELIKQLEESERPQNNLISRQEAIDVLEEQLDYLQSLNKNENPTAEGKWYGVNWARNTIADLPSVQKKGGAEE